jgi:hypothetical protein
VGSNFTSNIEIKFDHALLLSSHFAEQVAFGLDAGAAIIEADAAANAPVDTGGLQASKYRESSVFSDYADNIAQAVHLNPLLHAERPDPVAKGELVIGFAADYAYEVHEGTHDKPGNPFMMAAYERNVDRVVDEVRKAVESLADGKISRTESPGDILGE